MCHLECFQQRERSNGITFQRELSHEAAQKPQELVFCGESSAEPVCEEQLRELGVFSCRKGAQG